MIQAIQEAEKETSGEIRVHLVRKAKRDMEEHAKEIFEKIGMIKTQARNGVLIFFAAEDRQFVILGDAGIHEKVPAGFWQEIAQLMEGYFHKDQFAEGMTEAISRIGRELKCYFSHTDADRNELSDKISYS